MLTHQPPIWLQSSTQQCGQHGAMRTFAPAYEFRSVPLHSAYWSPTKQVWQTVMWKGQTSSVYNVNGPTISHLHFIRCVVGQYSDSLVSQLYGDRIPVVARFFAPIETGSGALPTSYGCRVSFPGVKRPGHGVNHPSPYSAEFKERVELYLYFPSGPLWPVTG